MSLEKKFSQLKNNPEFLPNHDWEKKFKHELLSEIHAQNRLMKATRLTRAERFDLAMLKITRRLLPSATKVVAGFLIILLGSGAGLAAQASVPGDALWPIKRSIEKAELTFANNPIRETEIHIKHINKRLREIDKIVSQTNDQVSPAKKTAKEKAIQQAVRYLEKDVAGVDSSLKIVREENNARNTVDLVKKLNEAAKEAKKKVISLESEMQNNNQDNQVIDDALSDVRKINNEVTQIAVNTAMELHEETAVKSAVKTDSGAATSAAETVADATSETEINEVKKVTTDLIGEKISELADQLRVNKEKIIIYQSVVVKASDLGMLNEVQEKIIAVEKNLAEASTLLEQEFVKTAFNKLDISKLIIAEIEAIIKQMIDTDNNSTTAPNTTTSTPPTTATTTNSLNPAAILDPIMVKELSATTDPTL